MTYDPSAYLDDGYGSGPENTARIAELEQELAELRAQAEAPETGAVEQPAQASPADNSEYQAALEALQNATTREEHAAALARYNAAAEAEALEAPQPALRPVNEVMSPNEVRELTAKLAEESFSSADYIKKLQAAGLATSGFDA